MSPAFPPPLPSRAPSIHRIPPVSHLKPSNPRCTTHFPIQFLPLAVFQMWEHLLVLCLFPMLTLGCFGGASLPGQWPGQINFDSYAAPPTYKTAPASAAAVPSPSDTAPALPLVAAPPPPPPLSLPAPLPPPAAPFSLPAPIPPQLFQPSLRNSHSSAYSIAPPSPSYGVSPPSSPKTEPTYATAASTVPPTEPTTPPLYSVVPPEYKLPVFPTLPPITVPALPTFPPPPPPEPIFFAGPPPPPPVKIASYSVGPPPLPPPPLPSYSVSPYEVPPPAYNPAFKVLNPTNAVESSGDQQQLSQNQGQTSKQDANQREEKGTEEARGERENAGEGSEKPKQFGVVQQAQKLDQPSVIGMNPLQMRDHLRTQLKKNRKSWSQP